MRTLILSIFFILLSIFHVHEVNSQFLRHKLIFDNGQPSYVDSNYYEHTDSIYKSVNDVIKSWHKQGHLLAAVDSFYSSNDTIYSFIHIGDSYEWNAIRLHHLPQEVQDYVNKRWQGQAKSKINLEEFKHLYHIIYEYFEYNQYPFATAYLDSIIISDNNISADLLIESGNKAVIDSIALHYSDHLTKGFIKKYFGLYDSMAYDIKTFEKINQKANALPFARLAEPWDINFGVEKNILNLYLKERKSNQANAIIGLQPSPIDQGKYMLTADVLFKVYNTFGRGDMLHLTYQQFQNNSPKLIAAIQYPFILNTNWGIEAQFDFMKYDTLFRKTVLHLDLKYLKNEQNSFSIFYKNESSRIIHFDTAFTKRNKKLPPHLDVVKQGLGLGFQLGRLDDIIMPRQGVSVELSGTIFSKKILKNTAIESISDKDIFDYNALYDSLTTAKVQFNFTSQISYFHTFFNIITLNLRKNIGYMYGQDNIYLNEMYTLGGHKLLRGFNELSVFTSQYALFTIDPRIYIGDNSYVNAFTDFGYLKAHYNDNNYEYKWMAALGIGAQLNTESGLFNISFALGKDGKLPLSKLKDMRVHLGYSIYF